MTYHPDQKLRDEIQNLANTLSFEHFSALSIGIGLGTVTYSGKTNRLPTSKQVLSESESTDKIIKNFAPFSTSYEPTATKSFSLSETKSEKEIKPAQSQFKPKRKWYFWFFGHIIDLLVIIVLTAFIMFSLNWSLLPEKRFSLAIAQDVASSLFKEWMGLFDTFDVILTIYVIYFIYAVFFKIAAGTTIGHFWFRDRSKRLDNSHHT